MVPIPASSDSDSAGFPSKTVIEMVLLLVLLMVSMVIVVLLLLLLLLMNQLILLLTVVGVHSWAGRRIRRGLSGVTRRDRAGNDSGRTARVQVSVMVVVVVLLG